ncbi:hypothetical protein E2C01_072411 [Portunus trituberculatus]|uniref:Uncharacterized protein n=1 Tax=Portunus trituberculatus TaxID=210409 RepID=A0A5B7I2J7_PORTR|nr:hypothetical protein [Portunus trituberculatus]
MASRRQKQEEKQYSHFSFIYGCAFCVKGGRREQEVEEEESGGGWWMLEEASGGWRKQGRLSPQVHTAGLWLPD